MDHETELDLRRKLLWDLASGDIAQIRSGGLILADFWEEGGQIHPARALRALLLEEGDWYVISRQTQVSGGSVYLQTVLVGERLLQHGALCALVPVDIRAGRVVYTADRYAVRASAVRRASRAAGRKVQIRVNLGTGSLSEPPDPGPVGRTVVPRELPAEVHPAVANRPVEYVLLESRERRWLRESLGRLFGRNLGGYR